MNRTKILLMAVLILLLIGAVVIILLVNSNKYGILMVNGVKVTNDEVQIKSDYAMLPLTAVMKGLDMTVNWFDENTAEVVYNDNTFLLNISDVSLFDSKHKNTNLLMPAPGGSRRYSVLDNEILIDSNTLKSVLFQMKINVNVSIDHSKGILDLLT